MVTQEVTWKLATKCNLHYFIPNNKYSIRNLVHHQLFTFAFFLLIIKLHSVKA